MTDITDKMVEAAKAFFEIRTTATISIPQYTPYDAFIGGWTAALSTRPAQEPIAWQYRYWTVGKEHLKSEWVSGRIREGMRSSELAFEERALSASPHPALSSQRGEDSTPSPVDRLAMGPAIMEGFKRDLIHVVNEWEKRRETMLADPEAKERFFQLRAFELAHEAVLNDKAPPPATGDRGSE
jgi:hypothetical protein